MWSLFVQDLVHNKFGIGNESRTYNVSASMQKQLLKIEQRYLQAFNNAGKHNTDAVRERAGNALARTENGNISTEFVSESMTVSTNNKVRAKPSRTEKSVETEKEPPFPLNVRFGVWNDETERIEDGPGDLYDFDTIDEIKQFAADVEAKGGIVAYPARGDDNSTTLRAGSDYSSWPGKPFVLWPKETDKSGLGPYYVAPVPTIRGNFSLSFFERNYESAYSNDNTAGFSVTKPAVVEAVVSRYSDGAPKLFNLKEKGSVSNYDQNNTAGLPLRSVNSGNVVEDFINEGANDTLFDTGESFDKTGTFNYNDIKDGDYSDDRVYGQKIREGFQSFRRRNAQNAGRDGRNSIKTPEIYLNKGDYSGVASQEFLKSRIIKELTKDSMAIDADGIPIIGYHGTSREFFEFKDNEKHNFDGSIGHHFSLNPVVSEMYAEYASYADDSKKELIYPSIFNVHSTVEIYPSDLNQNFDVANKLLRDILTLNEYVEEANFYDDLFYFLKNRGYSEKIIGPVVNAYKKYGTAIDSVMYRDAQWDREDGPINDQLVVFDGSNILPATQSFWDAFKKEFEENYTDSGAFSLPDKGTRYYTDISFDSVTPIEETRYADPMYYKSERVITALNQSKFDAGSLMKMLQGKGVKPDELKWLGLEQWLSDKKSVSKGELLQFIQDNRLNMTETTERRNDTDKSFNSEEHPADSYAILSGSVAVTRSSR